MTLKTVDQVMQMIGKLLAYGELQTQDEIRAELEKWRKEIDRLQKALKLQQEVSDKLGDKLRGKI